MKKAAVITMMCVLAAGAMAAENYWTGNAGDGNWMTAANWGNGTSTPAGTLPGTTADRANINKAATVNILAANSASAYQLDVSYGGTTGTYPSTLNIFGELNVDVNWRVAGQTGASRGFLVVDGGTLTSNMANGIATTAGVSFVGRAGLGNLTIQNGGTVIINNSLWTSSETTGYGTINLVDGLLHANGWQAYKATGIATLDTNRGTRDRFQMDITGGKLLLNNDRLAQMYAFADAGVVTGYGEAGYGAGHKLQIRLVEGYMTNGIWGTMTEVTAIPEPASLVLLGLGTLIFSKRRK